MRESRGPTTEGHRRLEAFLTAAGLSGAPLRPLTTGLSTKRFYRIIGRALVVLDAGGAPGLTRRYAAIAEAIVRQGGKAPTIHFVDDANGLALVDDFGDRCLSFEIDRQRDPRQSYAAATDALSMLYGMPHPVIALERMDATRIAREMRSFADAFGAHGMPATQSARFAREFDDIWRSLSERFCNPGMVVLGDFEPENLMLLGDRGQPSVAILDFDEAFIGDPAYDLACLVHSARRSTCETIRRDCIRRYADRSGDSPSALERRVSRWAVQRYFRILGLFVNRIAGGDLRLARYVPAIVTNLTDAMDQPPFAALSKLTASYRVFEIATGLAGTTPAAARPD